MKHKKRPASIKCPYCGRPAILRPASYIYKDKAGEGYLYVCSNYPECNSYVGVHSGTMSPKGSLANGDLSNKRIRTHQIFDKIWKSNIMSRRNAYCWMRDRFGLSSEQAHIGCFSDYMCDALMAECRAVLENNQIAC